MTWSTFLYVELFFCFHNIMNKIIEQKSAYEKGV